MFSRALIVLAVLISAMASVAPVSAGGMAVVHLDAEPTGVLAGEPVTIGFTVMQHDVTAVNVESAVLEATHRESGEVLRATAFQDGPTGHYLVEVIFPAAGRWKWSIIPAPFAGTSFESIDVGENGTSGAVGSEPEAGSWWAELWSGSCAAPERELTSLAEMIGLSPQLDGGSAPVEVVVIEVAQTFADLTAGGFALMITNGTAGIACADFSGTIWEDELVVGVQELGDSGASGIAMVADNGNTSEITIYLSIAGATGAPADGDAVTIEIVGGSGSWVYSPATVEVVVGTTVTWINRTEMTHTVTGGSLQYEDSSPIGPGESWSQTFLEAGTFDYVCAPHPFMTGSVVVAGS